MDTKTMHLDSLSQTVQCAKDKRYRIDSLSLCSTYVFCGVLHRKQGVGGDKAVQIKY
jgi:hypothetical protein